MVALDLQGDMFVGEEVNGLLYFGPCRKFKAKYKGLEHLSSCLFPCCLYETVYTIHVFSISTIDGSHLWQADAQEVFYCLTVKNYLRPVSPTEVFQKYRSSIDRLPVQSSQHVVALNQQLDHGKFREAGKVSYSLLLCCY